MERKYANMIWGLVILYILWRMYYWYFIKGFIVPVFYGAVFIGMIITGVWIYRWQADKEKGKESQDDNKVASKKKADEVAKEVIGKSKVRKKR